MILSCALAFIIFVSSTTTLAIILCEIFGQLTLGLSVVSCLVGFAISAKTFLNNKKTLPNLKLKGFWVYFSLAFFALVTFFHFFWLIRERKGSVFVIDDSNFVDLPNHIMYINYFKNGIQFWPVDPLFVGPLSYPFGMDLFNSLFSKLGFSYMWTLPIFGYLSALALLIALQFWGGAFAVSAFLMAGGGYNYQIFSELKLRDYQTGKPWCNILPLFSSQRGYLYAFPAGIILLWSWRNRFFGQGKSKKEILSPLLEGFIWGTMPLFHMHTFIVLSFVYLCWVLTTDSLRKNWVTLAWALPFGTYEVVRVTNFFHSLSLISLKWGWMVDRKHIFSFFWNNYGFFVPLALATAYFSIRKNSLREFFPFAFLYLLCFVILFAPYDWDNNKIMIWCYIGVLPLMYKLCLEPLPINVRSVCLVALLIPGFVAIAARTRPGTISVYDPHSLREICDALKGVDPASPIASAQVHPNPVLICGHRVAAPYSSFYWSLGHDGSFFEENLKNLMNGRPTWQDAAKALHVRYIFWGPEEARSFTSSRQPWLSRAKILSEGIWGTIYDLGPP